VSDVDHPAEEVKPATVSEITRTNYLVGR